MHTKLTMFDLLNKKKKSLTTAEWQEIPTNMIGPDGNRYPKGTIIKVFETNNFGWVILGPDTKTVEGNYPIRRIFKY